MAIEKNSAPDDFSGGIWNQSNDGMGGNTFATSGFSHKPQGLSRFDGEADVVDRFCHLAPYEKMGL